MRNTERVPRVAAWHVDVQKHTVTPAGADGIRRCHIDDRAVSGWRLVGSVVLVVYTFKLMSATGNSRRQLRTPKKFGMHLSAAASSPGFVHKVHDSLAHVSQAAALPGERSQLEARMPCTAQPHVISLPSELSWLFVQGMMQTARRPTVAPRLKAATRKAGHGRRTARRACVRQRMATAERKARRRVGSRLQTGLSPVCAGCTPFDPSTLRVQIQVGLRASRHMRTACSREADTLATSKGSCCEGTRSLCIQPKTAGALSMQTTNRL